MNNWASERLGDVLTFAKAGGTPSTSSEQYYGGSIPFVSIEDITNSKKWITKTKKCLSEEGLRSCSAWLVAKGDLLYSMYATLGKVRMAGLPLCTNQAIIALRSEKNKVLPEYLYYYLEHLEPEISRVASQTTQANLNARIVKSLPIRYPVELCEQRRIAGLLSAVDEQVEAVSLQATKQEEVCKAIEVDLLRRIAQTAERRQIGSFAEVGGGKRLPAGHDYSQFPTGLRYLRVTDFFEQTVDFHSLQSLQNETFHALRRYELQPRDLYISIAGSIGWAGVMPKLDTPRVILTENAARIRLEEETVNPDYLALFINSELGQQQIEERIGTGGGVPKLALERIRTIQVALPDEAKQRDTAAFIVKLRDGVRALRAEQAKLMLLKSGLARQLLMPEKPAAEVRSAAQ